jgi:hypothetical protein
MSFGKADVNGVRVYFSLPLSVQRRISSTSASNERWYAFPLLEVRRMFAQLNG